LIVGHIVKEFDKLPVPTPQNTTAASKMLVTTSNSTIPTFLAKHNNTYLTVLEPKAISTTGLAITAGHDTWRTQSGEEEEEEEEGKEKKTDIKSQISNPLLKHHKKDIE